jgi:hypothetical protein
MTISSALSEFSSDDVVGIALGALHSSRVHMSFVKQ